MMSINSKSKKRKKNTSEYLGLFIAIVLIAGCVFLVGLLLFGFKPAVVLSGSMEPEIKTGSLCIYNENTPYYKINKNDIIVFQKGNIKVTHRVIEVTDEGFVTKGDANETEDIGVVTPNDYIGKTIFSISNVGYILKYICTTPGKIMSITIVIALGLFLSLIHSPKYES